jgi:hypothetical protein
VTRLRLFVVLLAVGLLTASCATVSRGPGEADPFAVDVQIDAQGTTHLRLSDGDPPRELAALPAADGEVVHTAVRPSRTDPLTVLVLVRRDDPGAGIRYELRYAVDAGEERLRDLPDHLQVDAATAAVLDVPPLPVWAPDGSAVAWVEWNPLGTQLRALGWEVDDRWTRPASDAVAYRLDEVPPGVQLDGWEDGEHGVVVLTGWRDGERWRIAVESDEQRVAVGVVPADQRGS